ncbi:helix-turn-helix domain-containing protein [Streptomyces griseofuscus]|uniref:helix-turn-helix domain-containing protein n=1 Tax=Streptomyces griseofuscus TaxID=146922 RepID=UPI0038002234
MADEEETCRHDIALTLQALLRDVDEILRLLQILVHERQPEPAPASPASKLSEDGMQSLTDREKDVFQALVTGTSNRQIGRRLGITERTVKNNLHSIYRKLGVSSRAEAITQYFDTPGEGGKPSGDNLTP